MIYTMEDKLMFWTLGEFWLLGRENKLYAFKKNWIENIKVQYFVFHFFFGQKVQRLKRRMEMEWAC